MQLILLTPPAALPWEHEVLQAAAGMGLAHIHIRKPGWGTEELTQYLEKLDASVIAHAVLHYPNDLMEAFGFRYLHLSATIRKKTTETQYQLWKAQGYPLSTSFHTMDELRDEAYRFHHAFCSPVFPSISKQGHLPSWAWNVMKLDSPALLYALGGIQQDKVEECHRRGFGGVAVLGAVWQQPSARLAIKTLNKIKRECERLP